MNATTAEPTASMLAGAEQLLSDPSRWTAARRKSDGRRFWIVAGKSGVYYCDATACTCPSGRHRGCCSHQVAATMLECRAAARLNPCELPIHVPSIV